MIAANAIRAHAGAALTKAALIAVGVGVVVGAGVVVVTDEVHSAEELGVSLSCDQVEAEDSVQPFRGCDGCFELLEIGRVVRLGRGTRHELG
jgi:hypothetical protein